MEEILKRFGLPVELWLLSLFSAALAAMYRIVENETPISGRKIIKIVLMGVISGVLVPGLLDHVLHVENPFWSASITGLTVLCFEPLIKLLQSQYLKKVKDGTP